MIIYQLQRSPSTDLRQALAHFDRWFDYRFGNIGPVHLAHDPDWLAYYRARGPAALFVAQHEGRVLGTLGVSRRVLLEKSGSRHPLMQMGEIHACEHPLRGQVLRGLVEAAEAYAAPQFPDAFTVLPEGRVPPEYYQSKVTFRRFRPLARVVALRVLVEGEAMPLSQPEDGEKRFRDLAAGMTVVPTTAPWERSASEPTWLDGVTSCALVEDTRRACRWFSRDGTEMVVGHVSNFAYRSVSDGVALLRRAIGLAVAAHWSALWVSVTEKDVDSFARELGTRLTQRVLATISGRGVPAGDWRLSSADW